MLKRLVKLADQLDFQGEHQKADHLDKFIIKLSQSKEFDDTEPSDEDLMEVEQWLDESGIQDEIGEGSIEDELQDIAYQLESWEKLLNESDVAEARGMAEHMIKTLKQKIMLLASPASLHTDSPDLLPFQKPFEIEAGIMNSLSKIAEILDSKKLHRSADFCDKLLTKMASTPDEPDYEDEDIEDFDTMEPDTGELMLLEEESSDDAAVERVLVMMEFINDLANGNFSTLESAQAEAKGIMDMYEQHLEEEEGPIQPLAEEHDDGDNVYHLFGPK